MKTPRVNDFDPNAKEPRLKSPLEHMPVIEKPQPKGRPQSPAPSVPEKKHVGHPAPATTPPVPHTADEVVHQPVPPPVPRTVPRTPQELIPKVKRPIRQRQPFDIFEDQYERLKKIAEAEKGFVNGRGMSQMVRDAIDMYLQSHASEE